MSVLQKLMQVQIELKAPKNQFNGFGGYKYRSCEDILEAVKPIAAKYNAVVTVTDEIVLIGDRFYIKAVAKFFDVETGECEAVTAYAREPENKKGADASQVTGASSSYARKYALNGLFCIDDTKDADATNDHEKGENNGNDSKPAKQTKTKRQKQPEQQKMQPTPPGIPCTVCGKLLTVEYAEKVKQHYGTVVCSVKCAADAGIEI